MSELNSTGSWLSPKGASDFIRTVGLPTTVVMFLLAVMTGILPTPLMEGVRLIPSVIAQHVQMMNVLEETVYYQRLDCLRNSQSPGERAECTYKPSMRP